MVFLWFSYGFQWLLTRLSPPGTPDFVWSISSKINSLAFEVMPCRSHRNAMSLQQRSIINDWKTLENTSIYRQSLVYTWILLRNTSCGNPFEVHWPYRIWNPIIKPATFQSYCTSTYINCRSPGLSAEHKHLPTILSIYYQTSSRDPPISSSGSWLKSPGATHALGSFGIWGIVKGKSWSTVGWIGYTMVYIMMYKHMWLVYTYVYVYTVYSADNIQYVS